MSPAGKEAEELTGEAVLGQAAGLASGVDDEGPMILPPGWIALAEGLKGQEGGSAAADAMAFRVGDHEPGDITRQTAAVGADRKSTRLNSSHLGISYAVFC